MKYNIRDAKPKDAPQILELMLGLAEFEGYLNAFKVTERDIIARAFPKNSPPEFCVLVAENNKHLIGILVYYTIPFTFDLRPTLFIKEFFVDQAARGLSVGKDLFSAVKNKAISNDYGRIKWDVLHSNAHAKRFYERNGARQDAKWQGYILEL